MSEIVIRSSNTEALQKLADLVRLLGLEVFTIPEPKKNIAKVNLFANLPITYATKPDVLALAGIWKHKNINLDDVESFQNQLREEAWGGRM
jgi:hypothetical protein